MAAKPELLEVEPSSLLIGDNIRRDAHADTLVSSLKSNGMLHPIRARRTDDGLEVIDGQRRTLAAIQAGMAEVPVLVVDASDHGRVFEQYVSNEHREGLTDGDRVLTIKKLTLFGLNAGTIAKRTGMTKTTVEKAAAITDQAVELAPHGSLEDLADLASLEGEPEHAEAAERLQQGDRQYFRQIVQQARKRIAADAESERLRAEYPDLTILDTAPAYGDKQLLSLTGYEAPSLEHEDGTPVPRYNGWNVVPDLDEAIEHLGAALAVLVRPKAGYGDALTELGLYVDTKQMKAAGIRKLKSTSSKPEKTPEEQQAEDTAREQQKAWEATADDRKAFIARLMNEKQPPTGWELLVIDRAFTGALHVSDYADGVQTALRQMLGLDHLDFDQDDVDDDNYVEPHELLHTEIAKRPDRAALAILALALANIEESACRITVERGGWTGVDHKPFATHGHLAATTPAYLDQLEKWGYEPAAERALLPEVQA